MCVAAVIQYVEDLVPAEALFQRLRAQGPAVWAEAGARWTVVAVLRGGHPWSASRGAAYFAERPARPFLALSDPAPGGPGWWGFFAYEAGCWLDRAPTPKPAPPLLGHPFSLPEAWLGRAEATATFDRRALRWVLQGAPDEVALLAQALREARPLGAPAPPSGRRVYATPGNEYLAGVRAVREHLRAGDCYQVNLARRMDYAGVGDAFELWRRLSTSNPARRGFFLDTGEGAIVSNSPELLLSARPVDGRIRVRSVPIKGTAARMSVGASAGGGSPSGDAAAARRLLRSPKERAELTMIVDLVRADLGGIAVPGTVRAGARRVGAMGHVLHAVQAVEAELPEGLDARAALARLFPAGSITGAPRLRAMEVIHALEDGPRGVYCGSLGWFGDDGRAHWNVGIRTVTVREDRARLHVGAGLVIGSEPARELAETDLKAARMAAALEGG